jgi:hypothetical protein
MFESLASSDVVVALLALLARLAEVDVSRPILVSGDHLHYG